MLTTGSITTETFSAALLGLEDLSLRLILADLSEVLESREEDLGMYQQ